MKKITIITLIVALMVVIGSIGITKYSIKKETKETIGYYVDGVYQKETPDANKVLFSGYKCNDDSELKWNSNTWKLEIKKFKFGTKCKVYFITKEVGADEQIITFHNEQYQISIKGKKTAVLNFPIIEKDEYYLDGWYTKEVDGEKINNGIKFGDLASNDLYARWKKGNYTIFLNTNGTVNTPKLKVRFNETIDLPIPERVGYVFDGWFTDSTNGTKVSNKYNFNLNENVTLFAHWTKNTIPSNEAILVFDANGGQVAFTSKTLERGKSSELPTPTRDGYEFDGWYDRLVSGTKYDNNSNINDSYLVLYAHWKNVKSCFKVGPNAMEGYYENGVLTRCFFTWYNLRLGYGERLSGQGTQCEPYSTNDYNPLSACTAPDRAISCVDVLGSNCRPFSGFSLKSACNYEIRQVEDDEVVVDAKWFKDYPRFGGGNYLPEKYECP